MSKRRQSSLLSFFRPAVSDNIHDENVNKRQDLSSTQFDQKLTKKLQCSKIDESGASLPQSGVEKNDDAQYQPSNKGITPKRKPHESESILRRKHRRVIVSDSDDDDADMGIEIITERLLISKPIFPKTPNHDSLIENKRISAGSESFFESFEVGKENAFTFRAKSTDSPSCPNVMPKDEIQHFRHTELDFLRPDRILDSHKRRPSDPDYDPGTLYVPEKFLKTETPGLQQWWRFKIDNFDCLLFFKIGKFYELYHMDAVLAVSHLDLAYMKGTMAHCGFPETSYGKYADQLIQRGYKVARVEQTEKPKDMVKTQKVVRRELCRVTTIGTKTYGVQDGQDDRTILDTMEPGATFLLAVAERTGTNDLSTYGVCFVDTAVGKFHVGQFDDDLNRSFLRTVIAHYPPVQILYERGKVSTQTMALLRGMANSVQKEALLSKRQFLDAEKTIELMCNDDLLGRPNNRSWPVALLEMLDQDDTLLNTPHPDCTKAWSALGAILWYLKRCLIDVELMTMGNFQRYVPPTQTNVQMNTWRSGRLVLDGITLSNLHVVPLGKGEDRATAKTALLPTIDHCATSFGKRLLRQWTCAPLCDPAAIRDRQDAIQTLMDCPDFVDSATIILRQLPDLERLLQRIHTLGLKYRSERHPDGRAVMMEPQKYNKRKLADLLSALSGFAKVTQLVHLFRQHGCLAEKSSLLKSCFGENLPNLDISADLSHFETSFDHNLAKLDGVIIPERGVDAEYDQCCDDIEQYQTDLDTCLQEQRAKLRDHVDTERMHTFTVDLDHLLLWNRHETVPIGIARSDCQTARKRR